MASSTIPAGGGGGLQPKYQKFVTSGTFTLPDGYGAAKPLLVNIQVIGGGGGGAGNQTYIFNGNGGWRDYFGEGSIISGTYTTATDSSGGSGGLCATQLYLTSNLTVTVGAAGTRPTTTGTTITNNENPTGGNFSYSGGGIAITIAGGGATAGGTGGTSSASVLQATGGAGGSISGNITSGRNSSIRNGFGGYNVGQWMVDNRGKTNGVGGTPAGTQGFTTPLLGTLAGGSQSATPIRGSFGVGGISTDGATSTGAEGTGGGDNSIGASGAIILTWWQ
jgi:hypothetical protein